VNSPPRISKLQLAAITGSGASALGLFTYQRVLVQAAGREAFWSLLLAILWAMVNIVLLITLARRFPRQTPPQYLEAVYGKSLGKLLLVTVILFFLFLSAVALREIGDLVNTVFLPATPIEVTMLLVLLAAVYASWYGLEAVARFLAIVYPITLGLVALTFTGAGVRMTEIQAVIPSLPRDPGALLAGTGAALFALFGFEIIIMLFPFVRDQSKPYHPGLWIVFLNGALLLLSLLVTLGVWGVEPVRHLQYPGSATLRVLRMPGVLVERLGAFVALSWTMLGLAFLTARLWALSLGVSLLFGHRLRQSRYFLLPIALLIALLARLPRVAEEVEFLKTALIAPGLFISTGLTLLTLLVAAARGLGERT
jgi:spore germination protein (amino acid permease)